MTRILSAALVVGRKGISLGWRRRFVGVAVRSGVLVGLAGGMPVGVRDGVVVGPFVRVVVGVAVAVFVGVTVAVFIGVVFVGVTVGVFLGVFVGAVVQAGIVIWPPPLENTRLLVPVSVPLAATESEKVLGVF